MTTGELQQKLFTLLKSKMAEDSTAAEEIAGLLNISTDSACRRIRGEKTLSIDELQTLCVHYKVSLDQLMEIQSGAIIFYGQYLALKINIQFAIAV